MKEPTLPLPNPKEWLTTEAAAQLLGLTQRQVYRLAERQVLTAHRPYGGRGEKRLPVLWWRYQVEAMVGAREVAGIQGRGNGGQK